MIVLTLCVRDEIDIIEPMLEHHVSHGIERFIITDNGSVDGTREYLEDFASKHEVDLRDDPVHRKQQSQIVTRMARDAASIYGADWVINADADEFWVPVDKSARLAEVVADYDPAWGAFKVPVVNLTGEPARDGTGLARLIYRDLRSDDELAAVGLRAQPTHDCLHVGDPAIEVVQGNHWTNRASHGRPAPSLDIEVLHIPWRSWAQYERKIVNTGKAYTENPIAIPSPNHHGMRDYRRYLDGSLEAHYIARHPDAAAISQGLDSGIFALEDYLAARGLPEREDTPYDAGYARAMRSLGAALSAVEQRERETATSRDEYRGLAADLMYQLDEEHRKRLEAENSANTLKHRLSRTLDARGRAHLGAVRRRLRRVMGRLRGPTDGSV